MIEEEGRSGKGCDGKEARAMWYCQGVRRKKEIRKASERKRRCVLGALARLLSACLASGGGKEHGLSLEELGRQGGCSGVNLHSVSHLQRSIRLLEVCSVCEMIALLAFITSGHRTNQTFPQAMVSCHSLLTHRFRVFCFTNVQVWYKYLDSGPNSGPRQ